MSEEAGTPLLELRGVSKAFGAVQALSKVNLSIPAGKITALVGDNGAGKSVTIKTISGLWEPSEGEILWEGTPVRIHSPNDAERLGITTIYQDLALCDNLDIVQNMFLGHEKLRFGLLDETAMEIEARKTLSDLHVTTVRSIRQPVASLSGGQRQSVAVAKAVLSSAKLVIMDEPTAALGVAQTRQVLDLITRLSSQGTAVMVVSHNLNDVFAVADQITILYLGREVASGPDVGLRRPSSRRLHDHGAVVPGGRGVSATMTDTIDEPVAPGEHATGPDEHPSGAAPANAMAPEDLVALAPDVLADSLGDYLLAWWKRIRSGESGALPIIAGLIAICIFFEVQSSAFLTATNIVNLFIQATFIILLGLAELYALILSEIDLSVGYVGAVGAAIALALIGSPQNWPWWAGIIVGLIACLIIGAFQGAIITRLRIPSFVVTLAGLLGWQGVLIYVFDVDKGAVGGVISISNSTIDDLVSGSMTPVAGWIVLIVAVGLYALVSVVRTARRRAQGLSAPPLSVTLLTVGAVAVAGIVLVWVCNLNRGVLTPVQGVPWVIPFVVIIIAAAASSWPGHGSAATPMPSGRALRRPGGPASTSRSSAPWPSPSAALPPDSPPSSTPHA